MGRRPKKKRASPVGLSDRPLRRSARLASITARRSTRVPERRSSLINRRPNQLRMCMMEIAIAPPSRVGLSQPLEAPIVIVFRAPDSTANQTEHEEEDVPTESPIEDSSPIRDLSGIWAFLSLVSEDRKDSLAPPRTDLLKGMTADSIHPVFEEVANGRDIFAYVTFSGLSILEPGKYCFKVNVIDMNQSLRGGDFESGGRLLPAIHSEVFEVAADCEHTSDQIKMADTIKHLQRIGLDIDIVE